MVGLEVTTAERIPLVTVGVDQGDSLIVGPTGRWETARIGGGLRWHWKSWEGIGWEEIGILGGQRSGSRRGHECDVDSGQRW